jgi:hypothetical protein
MTQRTKQAVALAFLAFVCLWVAGLFREPPRAGTSSALDLSSYSNSVENNNPRQQFANNLRQLGLGTLPLPMVLDQADVDRIQVFEKTARLAGSTTAFDRDHAALRSALEAHDAVVFNETNGGIAPARRVSLEIGVHPDKFDALVEDLRGIARLESVSVQQRDRTAPGGRPEAPRRGEPDDRGPAQTGTEGPGYRAGTAIRRRPARRLRGQGLVLPRLRNAVGGERPARPHLRPAAAHRERVRVGAGLVVRRGVDPGRVDRHRDQRAGTVAAAIAYPGRSPCLPAVRGPSTIGSSRRTATLIPRGVSWCGTSSRGGPPSP